MKKNRLKSAFVKGIAGLCVAAMLAGCGGSKNTESAMVSESYRAKSDYSGYNKDMDAYESADALWSESGYTQDYEKGDAGSGSAETYSKTSASKRKMIKNVSMNVETQEFETLMANLEQRVKDLGGYIQNLESYNGSNYGTYGNNGNRYTVKRNASVTVRVPQDKLEDFENSISDLANVTNRRLSVEDVTLQYVDVQSHKESLKVEQTRLLELLEKAENLEDIITLENRLTSVRYQIESMESTLRTYDDLVDYSTVNLHIDEVEVYTPVEVPKESNWDRMINGFLESVVDVKDGFVNFGIWFVIHIPYLLIWAIVITVIVLIIKKMRKKNRAKKEQKRQAFLAQNNVTPAPTSNQTEEEKKN